MRGDSFSSFLIDDGNRRAHDLCLAVARCEPLSPMPLTFVAEPGCGKTHLLHAVANRLRASAGHAAIVFLTPGQCDPQIDRLVEDPGPIDMARYAVLLIDDLDQFHQNFDNVLRLVEIFLENDHPVLVASNAHPERLADLPHRLRRLLLGGQIIFIEPGDALKRIDVVKERLGHENREAVENLRRRIRELEAGGTDAAAERARARAAEFEKMRRQLAEARHEIEHMRAETALLGAAAKEADVLRARVDELEQARRQTLEPPADEAVPDLKRKFDEARFDAQKAREDARGMLERAEKLLEELQKNRTDFEAAHRETRRHRAEIQKLESVFSGQPLTLVDESAAETGSAVRVPAQAPVQAGPLPPADARDPEDSPKRAEEVASLRDEIHRLQESVVRAHAERDSAKSHLARVRDELEETRRDLATARDEADTQLCERDTRIRALEESLVERQEEYKRLQEAQKDVAEEMISLQSQITEGTDVLERLMELFGIPPEELDNIANQLRADSQGPVTPDPPHDTPADEASAEKNDAADDRADFGEGLRLVPQSGPSLHHVEELRSRIDAALPESLPPLDDGEDDEPMRGPQPKTA